MTDQQLTSAGSAAHQPLGRSGGLGSVGGLSALHSLGGGLGARAATETRVPPPPGSAPQAVEAGNLAGIARQAPGSVSHVAPALEAAARGETVAQQAERVTGTVKMNAADALRLAGAMAPDPGGAAQQSYQTANRDPATGFRSPFVSIGLSGITNDQEQAEGISRTITGDPNARGYAAYGSNNNTYRSDTRGAQPGVVSPGDKRGTVDAANDVAAVTQYAAAAELGITLTPNSRGDGRQVQIDWGALSRMDVQANVPLLGGKIRYDNPAQVANNGYQAVLADMATRNANPADKGQFISLTGHSGGGQSSFYTALRLASEGYSNVSVVGVDMAMTPHQREVLQALGVNVTNITSNANLPAGAGPMNSPVGDGIRAGMGGGQNFYDLNVRRQTDNLSPTAMHGIANDANVATTVRFAQYLDSIGQHGQYTPEQYQRFLRDSNYQGNQVQTDPDAGARGVTTADRDLFDAGSGKVADQRQLPTAAANSTQIGGGASVLETGINLIGGRPITQAIQGVGNTLHNGLDAAGEVAQSAAAVIPRAGGFFGNIFRRGAELLGSGVSAVGNVLGSGLNVAGNLARSTMSGISSAASFVGNAASTGLNALGGGVSAVGNTISNGLGRAGDTAQSWLGSIPLVGGFLGNVANSGLHLLGSGVSAVGNTVGSGVGMVGDAAQWTGNTVASGATAVGGLAQQGLEAAGSGVRVVGGAIGSGLSTVGGWGEQAITGASSAVGNVLGSAARTGLSAIGSGVDMGFDLLGRGAGAVVRNQTAPLVWALQAAGVDTSQIAGLSDFQRAGFNPSQQWRRQMEADRAAGVPSNVQTIPVPAQQNAAAPVPAQQNAAALLPDQQNAAAPPVYSLYAN